MNKCYIISFVLKSVRALKLFALVEHQTKIFNLDASSVPPEIIDPKERIFVKLSSMISCKFLENRYDNMKKKENKPQGAKETFIQFECREKKLKNNLMYSIRFIEYIKDKTRYEEEFPEFKNDLCEIKEKLNNIY